MFEFKLVSDFFKALKLAKLDDIVDKAHYLVTTAALLFFCMLIGVKQIFGEPIACMASPEFPAAWVNYVNEYCFVSGTYVLGSGTMPFEDAVLDDADKIDVSYYQWIPYMLAFQALCFYLPHVFWKYFQNSDIDYEYIIDQSNKVRNAITKSAPDIKEKQTDKDTCEDSEASTQQNEISAVTEILIELFESRQLKKNTSIGLGSNGFRAYIISQFLNLVNVFIQFGVLLYFVGSVNVGWGFKVIGNSLAGTNWTQNGYLPRVSFCTFTQTSLAQLRTHSVQCVLMINMLNEKVFVMLYFWFLALLVMTAINVSCTVIRHATYSGRRRAIERYLSMRPKKKYLDRVYYVDVHLGNDGLLLLRFIENSCGFWTASKVACQYCDALKDKKIEQFSAEMCYSELVIADGCPV
ncbi:innexin domain-containing protein [Ditylenchus destructor]|uniref:Innexin n=1 Tax=Ditylenchus destructor TaxID=166010 RepID=A0AAD4MR70_9BILA|nr:innexin domain-containing protein [Ditylenchus destructor]